MKPQDRERVIEQWMTRVNHDGTERYDDIHIDAIDPQWKNRQFWAGASRWAFQAGVEIRDRLSLPFTLGLGLSLEADSAEILGDIRLAELISRADWSPPSLYLFYPGQEPGSYLSTAIRAGNAEAGSVSLAFRMADVPAAKSAVFLRFRDRDSEQSTSAFLFG